VVKKMQARLQRLKVLRRPLEEECLRCGLRSRSTEELMSYLTDEDKAELESLKTLSNEQLLRVYHGEPLSAVLGQERTPA